jgi:hypothetical protein
VSEAEAAAIRAAFDRGGELSAAVELRQLFPGVTDTVEARECARTIAAWNPLPKTPRTVRLRPGKANQPFRRLNWSWLAWRPTFAALRRGARPRFPWRLQISLIP